MIKKMIPFAPAALMAVLFLTVLVLFNFENGRNQYVLFFPLDSMKGKNAEIRNIFRSSDASHKMDLFVHELLLGPEVLQMNPFIPSGTKLKASIIKDDTLYLDFNKDFINEIPGMPISYAEKINYIQENVRFNFPQIKEIVVTVEGQIPGSGFYSQSE